MKKNKSKDQMNYEELLNELTVEVRGIGNRTNQLLDVGSDIPTEVVEKLSNMYEITGAKTAALMGASGKDVDTNKDIKDVIYDVFRKVGEYSVSSFSLSNRINLIQEYNYILNEMPQLGISSEKFVDDLMVPDNFTKKSFIIEMLNAGYATTKAGKKRETTEIKAKEIEDIIEKRDLEKFVKDSIVDGRHLGTRYVYVMPHGFVANSIKARVGLSEDVFDKKKSRKNKTGINFYGEAMGNSEEENGMKINDTIGKMKNKDFMDNMEAVIWDNDRNTDKLYGESISNLSEDSKYHKNYSNNPIINEAKTSIAQSISDKIYSEGLLPGTMDKVTGCFIGYLNPDRVTPIVINRELIGVYYVEENEVESQIGMTSEGTIGGHMSNAINSTSLRDANYQQDENNPMLNRMINDELHHVLRRNLNDRFIKENNHLLEAVDSIFKNSTFSDKTKKVRFIPREFIVPFYGIKDGKGYGVSIFHKCRVPAHYWILLNQNNMYNKLFNEKDKLIAYAKKGVNSDIGQLTERAMNYFTELYPLPSTFLNLEETHVSMVDSSKFVVPVSKDGKKGIEFERIEGQKDFGSNMDILKMYETICTSLVGAAYSMMDPDNNPERAYTRASQDGIYVRRLISEQKEQLKSIKEFLLKVVRYSTGINEIDFNVTLPAPASLSNSIINDNTDKIVQKVDNQIKAQYGERALEDEENPSYNEAMFVKKEMIKNMTAVSWDWDFMDRAAKEYKRTRSLEEKKSDETTEEGE